MLNLMRCGKICRMLLFGRMAALAGRPRTRLLVASLRALASCAIVYENLPGATISPNLVFLPSPIGKAKWTQVVEKSSLSVEALLAVGVHRSEERRVGKGCSSEWAR